MLAVEEHIRIPFETQLKDDDFKEYSGAAEIVQRLDGLCSTHIDMLERSLDARGGHEAAPIKNVVTNVEGWFAGAIDKVRKTKVAKALRDDYTALGLCTVSYGMLLTTATAYGNESVAQLAERHLRDYAEVMMQISDAMPGIVIADLRQTGLDVDSAAIEPSRRRIEGAWRSVPDRSTSTGTVTAATSQIRT